MIYEHTEGRQNLQREQKQLVSGLNVGNDLAGSNEGKKNRSEKKGLVIKSRVQMPIKTALVLEMPLVDGAKLVGTGGARQLHRVHQRRAPVYPPPAPSPWGVAGPCCGRGLR